MNWLDIFGGIDRDRNRAVPMYTRICEILRGAIESGQLAGNVKLPTERELSALLQLDRSTVSRAYLELEKEGLVQSHVGRGTFVRDGKGAGVKPATFAADGVGAAGTRATQEPLPAGYPAMPWSEMFSRSSQTSFGMLSRQWTSSGLDPEVISFAGGIPTQEFFPQEEFRDIVNYLNSEQRSAEMFDYSPAEGHPALRAELRKHLSQDGLSIEDDELLIVSGSQQGIDLVTKTFVDPGDVVLVEEPTYLWANCIFGAAQARCIPVPIDAGGLQVDMLESILSRHSAKLLYLMPTFQNPTGSTLSMERRLKLLDIARRYQLPIYEDNFVMDLRYDGQALPSLKMLDASRSTVISQGTFSKALCPGLRVGWLVAPTEVMLRLRVAKRACDLSTNSAAQAIMAEYLRRGCYRSHLETVRCAYRERRDAMCAALTRHLGRSVEWSKPEGGLFVWVKLPAGSSSRELLSVAEREGVIFSPGDSFFLNGDRLEFFRLSFIQHDVVTIEDGVAKLGAALKSYLKTRDRTGNRSPAFERGSETALI